MVGHLRGRRAGRVTVLIADDEPLARSSIAEWIGLSPEFEVVGLAANADEAILLAEAASPDVAIVDVNMPGGGAPAVRGILQRSPRTRVVVLSGRGERATVLEMLAAGAVSYVVKGADPEELVETILRSARGASILSAEVADGVIEELTATLRERDLEEARRHQLREQVRRVIDGGLFEPVFQPIVDLSDGRTVGFEALSRFSAEPVQGADRWFADATEVGLHVELELAAARAAVARFATAGLVAHLSLNASPDVLPQCTSLLADVAGDLLVIEITEHAAIEDYEALAPALAELRAHGVRLAVDDAGAGFASLRHALQLSPDFIKLDVSLTRSIDSDPRRHALAVGLIGFANELGATIVAEGIETAAELETLRRLGVALGQGFFLAEPGPLPAGL